MRGFPGDQGFKRISLQPGELHFEQQCSELVMQTLLGSCVAMTFWHPRAKIGGMCHYLLPERQQFCQNDHHPQGYYGSDVMAYFLQRIATTGYKPSAFQVKLFGGGHVIRLNDRLNPELNVADANVRFGRTQLIGAGFTIKAEDVGGRRYRKVHFELTNGNVWVQYGQYS